MYIAPGQGQTTPWGQNFDVNRNSLSLCPFVAIFFCVCFFSHVYSPRQGQTIPWGQKFYDNSVHTALVYTVCPNLSVRKLRIITVSLHKRNLLRWLRLWPLASPGHESWGLYLWNESRPSTVFMTQVCMLSNEWLQRYTLLKTLNGKLYCKRYWDWSSRRWSDCNSSPWLQ